MTFTVTFNADTNNAIRAEASARAVSCEQVICDVMNEYFAAPKSPSPGYDAWFRARVEEGLADIKNGRMRPDEEAERLARERIVRLKAASTTSR